MKQGQLILESLLPGLTKELVAEGVPTIESELDITFFVGEQRVKPGKTPVKLMINNRSAYHSHFRSPNSTQQLQQKVSRAHAML